MKPWIPLLAGLSVSGAVLLALWLEEPPPPFELDLPELAAPLPPPPPLVRAVVAPSAPPPPQATQAPAPLPVAVPEEKAPPRFDDSGDSPRPGSDDFSTPPAMQAKRAARIAQALAGRKVKLQDELNSAIASGDREAEARVRAQMKRAEERMERARLQIERLRQQTEAERQ